MENNSTKGVIMPENQNSLKCRLNQYQCCGPVKSGHCKKHSNMSILLLSVSAEEAAEEAGPERIPEKACMDPQGKKKKPKPKKKAGPNRKRKLRKKKPDSTLVKPDAQNPQSTPSPTEVCIIGSCNHTGRVDYFGLCGYCGLNYCFWPKYKSLQSWVETLSAEEVSIFTELESRSNTDAAKRAPL